MKSSKQPKPFAPVEKSQNDRAAEPLVERQSRFADPFPNLLCSNNWIAWILIAVPAFISLLYVHFYGTNIAWEDQFYSLTTAFEKWYGENLGVGVFWEQHNEHRHFLPRLAMFAMGLFTDWNTRAEMFFVQVLLFANLGIILNVLFRQSAAKGKFWLAIPIAWLVFSLRQHQNLLCGFQLGFVMAATAAWAAYAILASLKDGGRWQWKFCAAILMATLGTVSSAHGLLLWIVGVIPLILLQETRRRRSWLIAVWLLVGAIEWGVYFIGYHKTVHPIPMIQERTLWTCADYFVAVVGAALFPIPVLVTLAGLLLLLIVAITPLLLFQNGKLRENSFWLTAMAFGLLTQVQVAIGRSPFGTGQAISSRYATFSLFVVVGVYGALSTLYFEQVSRAVSTVWGALLAIIILGIGLSYVEGFQAAAELKQQMDYRTYLYCTADSQPDLTLRFVPWEVPKEVRHNLAVLKEHHLNVFSSPEVAAQFAIPDGTLPTLAARANLQIRGLGFAADRRVFVIAGIALNPAADDLVGGVILQIDGIDYMAYYGLPVDVVTEVQKSPELRYCGFRREFSQEQLPPGSHRIAIKVLAKDRKAFFAHAEPQQFNVPDWPK